MKTKSAPRLAPRRVVRLPEGTRIEEREGVDLCCGFCRGRLNQHPVSCPCCGVMLHRDCHREQSVAQDHCVSLGCHTSLQDFQGARAEHWLRRLLSGAQKRRRRRRRPSRLSLSSQRRRRIWRGSGVLVGAEGGVLGGMIGAVGGTLVITLIWMLGLLSLPPASSVEAACRNLVIGGLLGAVMGVPLGTLIGILKARIPELADFVPRRLGAFAGLACGLLFGLLNQSPASTPLMLPVVMTLGLIMGGISGNILDKWIEDL